METKPKYRLKEAAARIGICPNTLRQKIQNREIAHESLGHRSKFIYQSEIDAYLTRNTKPKHALI